MTGRDLVTASLRLIGAIAPGESLAAAEATDGLAALNRMIDSWSNEGLIVFATTEESPLTLTPSDGTITMGASGDITTRPLSIERALIRDGLIDMPLEIRSMEEYARIPDKSTTSTYPYFLYDDGGYPQRTLKLYPVPSAAKSLILFTKRALTQIASLITDLSLPPGYERALVFNGAIDLAPEYGKSVPAEVLKGAEESKTNIKRTNHKPKYLQVDDAMVSKGGRFNFNTGSNYP